MFYIEGVPEDLPPDSVHDIVLKAVFPVRCRDGSVDMVWWAEYRGPYNPQDPTGFRITQRQIDETDYETHHPFKAD